MIGSIKHVRAPLHIVARFNLVAAYITSSL